MFCATALPLLWSARLRDEMEGERCSDEGKPLRSRIGSSLGTGPLPHQGLYPLASPGPGQRRIVDERYAALPLTDKTFIRAAFPDGLVPEGKDLSFGLRSGEVELVSTTGTTDEKVTNVWNQGWWDFLERESWRLNAIMAGVCTGEHREAILASARNVGFLSDRMELAFEERRLKRFLFLNERSSPVLWTQKTIERIVHELGRFNAQVLEANPRYLARFAARRRLGRPVTQPEVIVFTYENPSLLHMRQIRRVFRAPFVSSYGSTRPGTYLWSASATRTT